MSAIKKSRPRFQIGDWVSFVLVGRRVRAQIIEDRGPIGYQGRRMYGIRLNWKSTEPFTSEMPEDDLEAAPTEETPATDAGNDNGSVKGKPPAPRELSRPRFRVGDWVSFIQGTEPVKAQVIEDRGRLGRNGRRIYRLHRERSSTDPIDFEMPEDFLEPATAPAQTKE